MSTANIEGEHHLDAHSTDEIDTLENKPPQSDDLKRRNPELGKISEACYSCINHPDIWRRPPELDDVRDDADLDIDEFISRDLKNLMENALKSTLKDADGWGDQIASLPWETALFSNREAMEYYLKVECFASPSQFESQMFNGLVLQGPVYQRIPDGMAHAERKENPKLLVIKGDVGTEDGEEWTRIYQEIARFNRFIEMIEECKPDVIFVEKSVSPGVKKHVFDKFMALVCDVKIEGLEMIAECTGSSIFSYGDTLTEEKMGRCASFWFEEVIEEDGGVSEGGEMPNKSVWYLEHGGNFEGREQPKGRGCTILLKGTQSDELKRVKKAVECAYRLILESSFLQQHRSIRLGKKVKFEVNNDQVRRDTMKNTQEEIESLLVLMSKRNVRKGSICKKDEFSSINFYQKRDISVGKFLRDEVLNQKLCCTTCGDPSQDHSHCYAHHNMQLTIQVTSLPKEKHLDGENEGKIWMWACCGKCNGNLNFTERVPLSKATRSLSFGKFLELGFSNQASTSSDITTSSCSHSFYKDYLHFFGLGSLVAVCGYSQLYTYSVSLPNRKVHLSGSIGDEFLQKEAERVQVQGQEVFAEVKSSLQSMESDFAGSMLKLGGSIKKFSEIEAMLKEESDEFEAQMQPNTGNLVINHLDWIIFLECCVWDSRLHSLSTSSSDLKVIGMDETLPLEAPIDSEMGLTDLKSADPTGWMWKSFEEIKRAYMKDVGKSYLPEFKPIGSDTTIHTTIDDEGSKLRFPVGPDYNSMASDFKTELSSIIACALTFLKDQDLSDTDPNIPPDTTNFLSFDRSDSSRLHPVASLGRFGNSVSYTVGCRFAKQFMELRSICDLSEPDFIAGLSRCQPWEAKGGKSNAFFAKTIDDRFIIKEIQDPEYETFLKFGSKYFEYMGRCLKDENQTDQTCLAKIWGIYQVEIEGGMNRLLIVMENVMYGRKLIRQYDLKGALHNRLVPSIDAVGNVLLDQNFVNDMIVSPLYVTGEVLLHAVVNDTGFLSGINVMDYSLLVGVDDEKGELVCGIIDYLRQYGWDKTLETVYKAACVVPTEHQPTVIPPEEYKERFVNFMDMHFQSVPGDWCSQRPSNRCTLCNVANSS